MHAVYLVLAVSEARREVHEERTRVVVPHEFRRPCAADLAPRDVVPVRVLRLRLALQRGEVDVAGLPVHEVAAREKDESAVVAPCVLLTVALPLGLAEAALAREDVQVGRRDNVDSVRRARDVRVAYALLHRDILAPDDRLVAVHRAPAVRIVRDGHVQRMVCVLVVDHHVGRLLGPRRTVGGRRRAVRENRGHAKREAAQMC